MKSIPETLGNRPKWQILLLGLTLIAILGVIDYQTGDFSLTIFYILPVFLGAWYVSEWAGFILSIISGTAIVATQRVPCIHDSSSIAVWNTFSEVCFLIIMNYMFYLIKKELDREKLLARTDYLTGALNRRSYLELAEYEIKQSRRHHRPMTIAYIDLDNFKGVNDTLGHHVGDQLLCSVVRIMQEKIRDTDLVARIGGDEFSVLFANTDSEAAGELLVKLQNWLVDAIRSSNWPVTVSIGAVTYTTPPTSVEVMLREADARLYEVKQAGKNMVSHATIDTRSLAD